MINKIKRPLSIVLVVMMVVSLFTVVPISASAATITSDTNVDDISVGDILTREINDISGFPGYTVTLSANGFGTGEAVINTDMVVSHDTYKGFTSGRVHVQGEEEAYQPYVKGEKVEQWIVTAIDHDEETITLTGYAEPATEAPTTEPATEPTTEAPTEAPTEASALTIDDAQSLLSSMEAKMNDYYAQGDWNRADALKYYYDWLDEELEYADGEVTAELENAYNAAYEYFMAGGSGVSYPDVNNVYWATNEWVNVTVSDLQPGDVLGSSSDYLSVRKGDCDIVLVGGTYCDEDNLSRTYPNNVTLGNDIDFHFSDNSVHI